MKMKHLLIFISVMSAMNLSAQVNIGTIDPPHAAAVLDLSQKEPLAPARGLLMPHVKLDNLTSFHLPTTGVDTPEKATGMVVYNLAENASVCPGLYVWDGSGWNRLLGEACPPYIPGVEVTGCSTPIPPVRFMAYNLGADPQYDTPKKQMAYLATNPFSTTDASVYGGLYQWGRKDHEHAVNANSTIPTRYTGHISTSNTWEYTTSNETPIDTNGQPTGVAAGRFIFSEDGIDSNDENWYPDATNTHSINDCLWGNGKGLAPDGSTTKGGILYSGQYYQNTDWAISDNNPCPSGFRVPTQDEWERLVDYDCRPDVATTINVEIEDESGADIAQNNLTWVPVVCSSNTCTPSQLWSSSAAGHAIYPTNVWKDNNNANYRNGTNSLFDTDAPDPVLFLPAAGRRNYYNGNLEHLNSGRYWSSTMYFESIGYSFFLSFNHSGVDASDYIGRAFGFSVRCIAD
jgi:hypothetical protein